MNKWTLGQLGKNKPKQSQTKPIQTQSKPIQSQNKPNFKKAEMNVTSIITKDYENMSNWAIYENEPKQTQFLPAISVAGQSQKVKQGRQ